LRMLANPDRHSKPKIDDSPTIRHHMYPIRYQ
jgi:hypothetical protein